MGRPIALASSPLLLDQEAREEDDSADKKVLELAGQIVFPDADQEGNGNGAKTSQLKKFSQVKEKRAHPSPIPRVISRSRSYP